MVDLNFNEDDSLIDTPAVLTPEGPFFFLEILDAPEVGNITTALTFHGFEEQWQRDILKSMLHEIADSL